MNGRDELNVLLITKWFGTFVVEGKKVKRSILFPPSAEEIGARLAEIQRGHILREEEMLARGLRLTVSDARLRHLGKYSVSDTSFLRAEEFGFSQELLVAALNYVSGIKAGERAGVDRHLSQASEAYSQLEDACNALETRLHTWYSVHYPELEDHLSGKEYISAVAELGNRDAVQDRYDYPRQSIGTPLAEGEEERIMQFASTLLSMKNEMELMGRFIDRTMPLEFPNLTALLGPRLACTLLSAAGGIDRLSSFPAGTVQLIGAEKALFRHLKGGRRPPKHGLIFKHPLVHGAPKKERGRRARTLAGKITIAARLDRYGGKFKGEEMRRALERRFGTAHGVEREAQRK